MTSAGGNVKAGEPIGLPTLPVQALAHARPATARESDRPTAPAIRPNIPQVPRTGFPREHFSTVQHWGFFSEEEITCEAGRLLMLVECNA